MSRMSPYTRLALDELDGDDWGWQRLARCSIYNSMCDRKGISNALEQLDNTDYCKLTSELEAIITCYHDRHLIAELCLEEFYKYGSLAAELAYVDVSTLAEIEDEFADLIADAIYYEIPWP